MAIILQQTGDTITQITGSTADYADRTDCVVFSRPAGNLDQLPEDLSGLEIIGGQLVEITPERLAAREAHRTLAAWAQLRAERTRRLSACDWTQLVDAPLTEAQQLGWQVYRDALRELPGITTDPACPVWPVPPVG